VQKFRMQNFSWGLFALQQFGVPLLSVLATGAIALLLVNVTPASKSAGDTAGVIAYLFPAVFGFFLGVLARSIGAPFRQAGRFIWVFPLSLFTIAFLSALFSGGLHAIPEFFGVRGGETEEGIGAILMTFPTVACCCYAFGIGREKRMA
jgi:hypothetical protein